jgi:mannose-6-phosphate isomerase-like protein (cupin superfamily)
MSDYTLVNIKQSEDMAQQFGMGEGLEGRFPRKALGLEQTGIGHYRLAPGYRLPFGHSHRKNEEVYLVIRGTMRVKLDDEIVEVGEWDVVRVPPGTWRGYEAGPEGLELIVYGAPHLGAVPRDDVVGARDWWAD